jgi:hypothetical protein
MARPNLFGKTIKPGSPLWYVRITAGRLRAKRLDLVKGYVDYYKTGRELEPRLANKALMPGGVTVVITSAGRKEYLKQTIESLQTQLTYDPAKLKWSIIDDYPASQETQAYIRALPDFQVKLLNEQNRGLGYSLNKIYEQIETEFVFHCEDDWLFLRPIDLPSMVSYLRERPHLRQLLLYREPIRDLEYPGAISTGTEHYELEERFSFNPHLARTALFHECYPFPLHYAELEYTLKLERRGYKTSGVVGSRENPYVRHMGVTKSATFL